ncbi:MAG: helix-turn-helix transcriptional regulator [Actinomycetota bacterium]|nr:helix-turn-helix transcriptional regulator [Actinomycetota bacterium]
MTPANAQTPTPTPTTPRHAQAEHRRLRLQANALLDTATLRRLRLQAGYSTRRFARALGVSASTIRGLEEGSNHDQLPLSSSRVSRSCSASLHKSSSPTAPAKRSIPAATTASSKQPLQSVPGVVAIAELARALEWKLERTRHALSVLGDRLQSTGARLHRNGWQQCAIRPATQHLSDNQQQALHRIGPRDRGPNHITARLLLTATRGELDDRWFKTASNSERVALQSLLKQRVLLTPPGQTEIIPAPEMIYGLDPHLREPPPLGALSPVGRRPEDHPGRADYASSTARATEQLTTPD